MPLASDHIVLNVGGRRYETSVSLLTKYPGTLLGDMFIKGEPKEDEYFFDRNADAFSVILDYYRNNGRLLPPNSFDIFSAEMLALELEFFKISYRQEFHVKDGRFHHITLAEVERELSAEQPEDKISVGMVEALFDRYGSALARTIRLAIEQVVAEAWVGSAHLDLAFSGNVAAELSTIKMVSENEEVQHRELVPLIPRDSDIFSLDWLALREFLKEGEVIKWKDEEILKDGMEDIVDKVEVKEFKEYLIQFTKEIGLAVGNGKLVEIFSTNLDHFDKALDSTVIRVKLDLHDGNH
ncbi:BTB/POZ protein [Endogone sp. FLAS-F59071]|nr:BTB/POZ protein [Endogone sp. FLAS-F59071]|eukprot:RUS15231.1 BTB/POZ protein [Endogone sp. FLAS-F59071]